MKNKEVAEILLRNPEDKCGVAVNDELPLTIHAVFTVQRLEELNGITVIVGRED